MCLLFAVCMFLSQEDLANALDSWLASVAGWTAVWGGIMMVHFFVIEKHKDDFTSVLKPRGSDSYPLIRWQALIAFFLGLVMCWAMSANALFQGPIASLMGGIDLSWLGGMLTSAFVYFILNTTTRAQPATAV